VVVSGVAREVDRGEPSDFVPVAVPVVGFVRGVTPVVLFGDPRLDVVPLDDAVEPPHVVPVAVGDDESLRVDPDRLDAVTQRLDRVSEPRIEERRDAVDDEERPVSLPAVQGFARDVVDVVDEFRDHVTTALLTEKRIRSPR
jgi:hypothetical protein